MPRPCAGFFYILSKASQVIWEGEAMKLNILEYNFIAGVKIHKKVGNSLMRNLYNKFLTSLAHIGLDPNDEDDIRLQKSLLVILAVPFIFAAFVWGLI